ncbi:hypothetical protein GX411_07100 [Candidatus Fermentibacteria bacterium]|nr:hypothetical protein [Candidatus Fermentibacteria bacterium]
MDYGYLVLVAAGFALSVLGFVMLGRRRRGQLVSGIVFTGGIAALVLGILLTCVPDFFKG